MMITRSNLGFCMAAVLSYTATAGSVLRAEEAPVRQFSQYGITWTFDRPVQAGQFANGDWWVLGPVTLTTITPKTGDGGSSFSNGSMINPVPGETNTQGFYRNGAESNPENLPKYDPAKNISLHLPVTVPPGSSVYSTINNPDTYKLLTNPDGSPAINRWGPGSNQWNYAAAPDQEKTWFKETAVLTVLAARPPDGSFRPPYAGTDKTIRPNWNVTNLNFSVLRCLAIPVPANAPSLPWLEEATRRPLLEMAFGYLNSNWKASWEENKPGGYPRRAYGREVAGISSGAALLLNTDLADEQKQKLAIHLVQWGIDTHGLLKNGMQWWGSGGHQNGRLLPLYLAGKMLNDTQILAQASCQSPLQEMTTHFLVDQSMIDTPRKAMTPPAKPYTPDMLGMPEWACISRDDPGNSSEWIDGKGYASSGYRYVAGGPTFGTVVALILMGGRAEINHEAFFRYYIERYYPAQKPAGNGPFSANSNAIQPFARDMWEAYGANQPKGVK